MTIGERIKDCRLEKGLTLREVAEHLGVKEATAQRYESGNIKTLKQKTIAALANLFSVSPGYLMGWTEIKTPADELPPNAIPLTEVPCIPVVGKIAAGQPILAVENIIGYQYFPGLKHPEEYFCLLVRGDSMINAGILPGMIVLVHRQNTADDGQIVACLVNGDEATLKRFKRVDDMVVLMPENPDYKPIVVKCFEFENGNARILGIVKQSIAVRYYN